MMRERKTKGCSMLAKKNTSKSSPDRRQNITRRANMCQLSKFEQLPDEMLLEICTYLRSFDIINAFGQLNSRLEQTISQFRSDFDLHHLTLTQFQRYCSHFLPYVAEHVVNLVVSNWNSPGQIRLFNAYITKYNSLRQLFPLLNQLRLIDFGNSDIDILPKFQGLEKIMIDVDTQVPMHRSTEILLDHYLFCSRHMFKEVRLWGTEGGIRLQHDVVVVPNFALERLTIDVATLDDLILIFRRAPYLFQLYINVSKNSTNTPKQRATPEMMPTRLTDFHFQTNDKHVLVFNDLDRIVSNIPTIQLLSLDIETDDAEYSDGNRWNLLRACLPNLRHFHFKTRVWLGTGTEPINVSPFVESFEQTHLAISCYADSRVLYIDTVPYDFRQFHTCMGITSSPRASSAQTTNAASSPWDNSRVHTLALDGRHESTKGTEWLSVLSHFPRIKVLDLTSINITDQTAAQLHANNKQLRLPHLGTIHYVRSTRCKANLSFFLFLCNNAEVTPRLNGITMMYGDIIHLCERLPGVIFERIHVLWIYSVGADGHATLSDINMLLLAFPHLHHFAFQVRSAKNINRHAQDIIDLIVRSQSKLTSFRLSCKKGSLLLPALIDDDACNAWIKRMYGLNNHEQVHLIVSKKEVSMWK